MKKIKVFVFQNGLNRVYLPYAANADSLLDVTIKLVKAFNPHKQLKRLQVSNKKTSYEITVDSACNDGFVFDGIKYVYGEVYRRVS